MNRLVVVVVALAAAAIVVAALLFGTRSRRPETREVESRVPAVAPAPSPTRPASTPPPAAVPSPTRSTPPRRSAASKTPEATPEPSAVAAPAPVDLVTLRIGSDVPGSQVFIDRVFLGKTPLTTTEVKPGQHRLNVSAPGYDGVARDIDVAPGTNDITVSLREVRLDLALPVVHKHRMGSCQGRLVATPAGLRYETTDRDDLFSVPLSDLEVFEVDYLEKNLRIKPRPGKRYDFTDPEGKADNLFVFHRDVQKARERLSRGDPPARP